jgi:YihY family inner membrane protein
MARREAEWLGRFSDEWKEIRGYAERHSTRDLLRELSGAVEGNHLMLYASAMAFRIFLAVVPFALAALAVLGSIGHADIWFDTIAPEVKARIAPAAFELVDETARSVLASHRIFWLTAGAALTLWQVAAAVRAAMHALNDVYEVREEGREPGLARRLLVSHGIALAVSAALTIVLLLLNADAFVAGLFGDSTVGAVVSDVLRWTVAIALMLFVVGLLIKVVPGRDVPTPWIGGASLLTVGLWIASSAIFGLYAAVSGGGAVFGGVAFLVVAGAYLYVASAALLVGAQLDALIRSHAGEIE